MRTISFKIVTLLLPLTLIITSCNKEITKVNPPENSSPIPLFCSIQEHIENNYCVDNTRVCKTENGTGKQVFSNDSWGSCSIDSCSSGFELIANACFLTCSSTQHHNLTTQACEDSSIDCSNSISNSISATENWTGASYSSCSLQFCQEGYSIYENSCVQNSISCLVENGSGIKFWDSESKTYGNCSVSSCSYSFHSENNLCLSNTQSCSSNNGTGTMTWEELSYSGCSITSCNSSFELISGACYPSCSITQHHNVLTQACDQNSVDCSSSVINSLVATSSWNSLTLKYNYCLVASCSSTYILDSNSCPIPLNIVNSASTQYVIKNNSLSLSANGAISPYTYSIKSGVGSVSSAGVFSSSVIGGSSVKVSDNGTQSATAAINVVDQITGTDLTIIQGSTAQLNILGGSGILNYVSGDSLISTVDSNGLVTAISPGTTSILVSDGNNSSSFGYSNTASIAVTITGIQLLSNNLFNSSSLDANTYIEQSALNLTSDGSPALSSSFQSASNVSVFDGNSKINFSSTNYPINALVSSYTLSPNLGSSSISTASGVSSISITRSSITTSQNIVFNAVSNGTTIPSNSVPLEHLSSIRLSNTAYNTIQNFTDMGNAGNYKIFRNYNSKNAMKIYSYNMTSGEIVQLSAGTNDDQNDWLSSFSVNNLHQANNRVYYLANNSSGHRKLFSTDGVSIKQVSNINGDGVSDIFPNQNVAGAGISAYFWATNSVGSYKLFRSDGLSLVQVANTSGSDSISDWLFARYSPVVTILNGNVYFSSNNSLGYSKLFKSDNTACTSAIPAVCSGTTQVSNTMKNDSSNDIIGSLVTAGNYIYFDSSTGPSSSIEYINNYPKLFKTDGSLCAGSAPVVCSGSLQVSNVAGSGYGDAPQLITYSAPYVYFYSFNGEFSYIGQNHYPIFKIYRTTGEPCSSSVCSGTAQVANTSGADAIDDLVNSIVPSGDGGIYFIARSMHQSSKLFKAGAGSCSGSSPVVCTSTNQVANTTASNSSSDNINSIYSSNGIAYFTASTSSGIDKIFKTTGVACNGAIPSVCLGTNQIVNNFGSFTDSPSIYGLATSPGGVDTLYYSTGLGSMTQLYSYNSTSGNSTSYSTVLGTPTSVSSPVYYNNGLYDGIVFSKNSVNVTGWSPTNSLIPTIVPTIPTDKNPDNIGFDGVSFKGNIYYSANNQYQKNKLMKYDGSVISQVSNTSGASAFSDEINYITTTSNGVYFVANNPSGVVKLFKFDGLIVSQISNTSGTDGSFDDISNLVAAGSDLYFSANNSRGSQKLYKTSGAACSGANPVVCSGTNQVSNTSASDFMSDNLSKLTMIAVGNNLYFSAMLSNYTTKLFKTDGTACGSPSVCSGTSQVSNTSGGSTGSDQIASLSSANGIVYFSAWNQNSFEKLFRTDGTACVGTPQLCSGTYQVSNTSSNNSSSDGVGYSIGLGNSVLFYSINPSGAKKIWKTDGSPCSGTTQVICSGVSQVSNTSGSSTVPDNLITGSSKYKSYQRIVSDGSYVYFSAQNPVGAFKYYRTDGTSCVGSPVICGGTVQVANTSGRDSISDNVLGDDWRSGFIGLGSSGEVYFNGTNSNGFKKPYRVQFPSCSGINPVSCSGTIQVLSPLNNDSANDDCLLIATKTSEAYFKCYLGYNGYYHVDKLYKVIKN